MMYIFGGRSRGGIDLGDLAAFDIASRRWYTFQGDMGLSPSARIGHRMCVHNEKIFVVGGRPFNGVGGRDIGNIEEELALIYTLDTSKIKFPS